MPEDNEQLEAFAETRLLRIVYETWCERNLVYYSEVDQTILTAVKNMIDADYVAKAQALEL
jgi:hypothetical protein